MISKCTHTHTHLLKLAHPETHNHTAPKKCGTLWPQRCWTVRKNALPLCVSLSPSLSVCLSISRSLFLCRSLSVCLSPQGNARNLGSGRLSTQSRSCQLEERERERERERELWSSLPFFVKLANHTFYFGLYIVYKGLKLFLLLSLPILL